MAVLLSGSFDYLRTFRLSHRREHRDHRGSWASSPKPKKLRVLCGENNGGYRRSLAVNFWRTLATLGLMTIWQYMLPGLFR